MGEPGIGQGSATASECRYWVVLNPTHDERRQRPTLMEEIVHVHLKPRTDRLRLTGEVVGRSYKKSVEQQAYFVGAAALLPQRVVKGARTRGWHRRGIGGRAICECGAGAVSNETLGSRTPGDNGNFRE